MTTDAELFAQQIYLDFRICIWRKTLAPEDYNGVDREVLYKGEVYKEYQQIHSDRNLDLEVLLLRLKKWCDISTN